MGFVMTKLIAKGYKILLPIGDNARYDFVIEKDKVFQTVQCKTGNLKEGTVIFPSCSLNLEKGKWVRHSYHDQVDLIGIYCPANSKVYLMPVANTTKTYTRLRIDPKKNNQEVDTPLAETFEV